MNKKIDEKMQKHLVDLFRGGLSAVEISKKTGVSIPAVSKYIKKSMGYDEYERTKKINRRASLIRFNEGQRKLGIKRPGYYEPKKNKSELSVPIKNKRSPIKIARSTLRARLQEKGGEFLLDGIPTNLTLIMQATNGIRKNTGLEQIDVNPDWRV